MDIRYHTRSVSERHKQGRQEKRGSRERGEETEAFVSAFLTVGIGNSQNLSITSEAERMGWPICLMKRSKGGRVGVDAQQEQ